MKIGRFIRTILGVESRLNNLQLRQRVLEKHLVQIYNLSIAYANDASSHNPMIVPRLSGGLGNQLFQIATAYALALRNHSKLAINYDRHLSTGQGNGPLKYKDNLYKKIPETTQWPAPLYQYHEYVYCPPYPAKHLQIDGYFQSEKYFSDYQKEVRELFEFPEHAMDEARRYLGADGRQTVGIHIRLGDYLSERYKGHLNVCTSDYYQRALRRFSKGQYRFIYCSDSPEAAAQILKGVDAELFQGSDEVADMALLSQCNNLIISNSSFSWWSSFLGVKKETVMAPKNWFALKLRKNDIDMYQPDWIKVKTGRGLFL
jgi:hypothetical protein